MVVDADEEESASPEIAKRNAAKKFLKDNYEWNSEIVSADDVNKRPLVRKHLCVKCHNRSKDRSPNACVRETTASNTCHESSITRNFVCL